MMRRLVLLCASLVLAWACGPRATAPSAEPDWDLDVDGPDVPVPPPGAAAAMVARPVPLPATRPATRSGDGVAYRGQKIDVDFARMELHNVFRMLSEVGGINIVVGDDIKGAITLRLRRVPWDQVLHTVVKMKGLTLTVDHGLYLITQ